MIESTDPMLDVSVRLWHLTDTEDVPATLREIADRLEATGATLISVYNSGCDHEWMQVVVDVG